MQGEEDMEEFTQINILDFIDIYGESKCHELISTFECPINSDIAHFIHNNAIEFAKQQIAISYLIIPIDSDELVLAGFFTLTNKFVNIDGDSISKTLRRRIQKFSQYDKQTNQFMVAMPLIAQLGKNFSTELPIHISGIGLLEMALKCVQHIEHMLGGKTTYIECDHQQKLFEFYSRAGFLMFNGGKGDGVSGGGVSDGIRGGNATDEVYGSSAGSAAKANVPKLGLVQMLKYFRKAGTGG